MKKINNPPIDELRKLPEVRWRRRRGTTRATIRKHEQPFLKGKTGGEGIRRAPSPHGEVGREGGR
jgi:hypothetical protein